MSKEIVYRKLVDLKKLPNNPRTIKREDMDRLKESIKNNPDYFEARPIILSDRTGELVILAGNQRYEAAKALGMTEAPTFLLEGLTEEREREIIIRDNVSNGDWDLDALANDWDISLLNQWGVDAVKPFKDIIEDDPDPVDEEKTYSVTGKIYKLGEHRVFCGSFDDDEMMKKLFGDKKATMTFTDPPYNVGYESADGKKIQNDKMDENSFETFLNDAFRVVAEHTALGGGVISWMSTSELFTLYRAMKNNGIPMRQMLCWVKSSFTLGRSDFQFQHEPAIYGIDEGKYDGSNQDGDGEYALYSRKGGKWCGARNLSTCWFFEKPRSSKDHPTMKPIGLCTKGILALSEEKDIVFDPFLGAGSTLIACEQTGRICFGSEIDPKYCDVIRKRYWKFATGGEEGWQDGTKATADA